MRSARVLIVCSVTEAPGADAERAFGVVWLCREPRNLGHVADATNESEWIVPGTLDPAE
jgi:hypothetical protein